MSDLPLHPYLSYRCKEDMNRNCRTSCSKFMRGECDGRNYMLEAGGTWCVNVILKRKKILKEGSIKIIIEPGDLPGRVKFVEGDKNK